jgi:mono/diheme cytochrome c family protein
VPGGAQEKPSYFNEFPSRCDGMSIASGSLRQDKMADFSAGTILGHVREVGVMRASVLWMLAAAIAWSGATATAGGQRTTDTKIPSLLRPSLAGSDNFNAYCAPCHGRAGTGDGPVAPALTKRPADLTKLALRNDGVFPSRQVREFVTHGNPAIAAHGSSDMPIWGPTFRSLEPSDTLVATRIANIVAYLESIQQ